VKTWMNANTKRRDFCTSVAGIAMGMAGVGGPALLATEAEHENEQHENEQVGEIYQLQAAFHRAKTTQDINLMMSLWDVNGILHVQGDPNSPYIGLDRLMSFWQSSGSFTHRRFSLVPSFKIQIHVYGHQASLYFECHDVGDYDLVTRSIAADTFLAGTLRKVEDRWLFFDMTAGRAFPLSVDHYYFP
jgi:hypothetical protein